MQFYSWTLLSPHNICFVLNLEKHSCPLCCISLTQRNNWFRSQTRSVWKEQRNPEGESRQSFIACKWNNNSLYIWNGVITDMVHWMCIRTVNAMDSVGVFQEWNRIHSIHCFHTVEHLMHSCSAPKQTIVEEKRNQTLYGWITGHSMFFWVSRCNWKHCFVYLKK